VSFIAAARVALLPALALLVAIVARAFTTGSGALAALVACLATVLPV
jgi:hypothetical protein